MRMMTLRAALATLALLALSGSTRAGLIQITVTNSQPAVGFGISPTWIGLSDGSFSSFDAGDSLTGSPYQSLAELGGTTALRTAFDGFGPQTVVGGGPFVPGATSTSFLNVGSPATTRYLNYASMVVPSNDFFFGNDNAHQIALFNAAGQLIDADGALVSRRTIRIFGAQVWDAGTEVNNADFGAAYLAGVNARDHAAENGVATLVFGAGVDNSAYINGFNGRLSAPGYLIGHVISPGDLIATIEISAVPEPSSIALAGVGALSAAIVGFRRRRAQTV